ncbi:MAG: cytochrome C, partial [Verrucomicrobiota bacterium]
PVDHPKLTIEALDTLAGSTNPKLQREAVRALAIHANPRRAEPLAVVANNTDAEAEIRADAIAGLAAFADSHQVFLQTLASDSNETIAREAARTLGSAGLTERNLETKPLFTDIAAWEEMLDALPGEANLAVGRRLFFHRRLATCSSCHSMNGRGIEVGPDLTTINQQGDNGRTWLLEHILNPNAEVAPYFRPQTIQTRDGKAYMGFILGKEGKAQTYVGPDGKKFSVLKDNVLKRDELPISLMPPGLLAPLSTEEIRDLIAYILKGKD